MTQLTRGAVDSMHKGQQISSPVVQVIDVKKILGPNGQATTPERYRCVCPRDQLFGRVFFFVCGNGAEDMYVQYKDSSHPVKAGDFGWGALPAGDAGHTAQ